MALAWIASGAGCGDRGIEEHTVAKGTELVPPGPTPKADAPTPTAENAPEPWAVPDGWTRDAEPREMRLATYHAPDPGGPIEVAITRFAGRVGGERANINRWRGQMGLAPIDEGELEAAIVRFGALGYEGYQTRIESPRGVMLAAGIYELANDRTWFVRATARDAQAANRLHAEFSDMARSMARGGGGGGGP